MGVSNLRLGGTFAGDFTVLRFVDRGGMGDVYQVQQHSTGQLRALKLMHAELLDQDPNAVARFQQEATAAALIQSNHVVQVITAGVYEGHPWLAMEWLDGDTLWNVVQKGGPLPMDYVRMTVRDLAHALVAAHAAGVIHRDLKPENVFLARSKSAGGEFTVKVLDFGIAKVTERRLTVQSMPLGTLGWAAPEQLTTGAPVGPHTDAWAFGLVVFWLLAARPYWITRETGLPFSYLNDLAKEMANGAVVRARQRAASLGCARQIPEAFDGWFARCLTPDPAGRFPDVASAVGPLQQILAAVVDPPGVGRPYLTTPAPPSSVESENLPRRGGTVAVPPWNAPPPPTVQLTGPQVSNPFQPSPFGVSAPPVAVPRAPEPPRKRNARRNVIAGAAGATLLGVVGVVGWTQSAAYANKRCVAEAAAVSSADAAGLAKLCDRACESSFGASCIKDGQLITRFGLGVNPNELARRAYEKGCGLKETLGCRKVGEATILRDVGRAKTNLDQACTVSDSTACAEVGAATELADPTKVKEAGAQYDKSCLAEDPLGCAYNASLLFTGRDGTRNLSEAQVIFRDNGPRLEAKCDEGEGMACVGGAMAADLGGSRGAKSAESLLTAGCKAGAEIGCENLTTLRALSGPTAGVETAVTELRTRCGSGVALSCANLGALESGSPLNVRYGPGGVLRLKFACDNNMWIGCAGFGSSAPHPAALPVSKQDALVLSEKACAAGELTACVNAGALRCWGQDDATCGAAVEATFQRACDHGDPGGCGELGSMYKQGRGRPLDEARGKELTDRACKAGELDACINLADDSSAAGDETLRRYCEQERISSACTGYGEALADGRGVKQDPTEARAFLERASRGDGLDQPSTEALFALAVLETDDQRAASMFHSACDKHLPAACAEYGRMLAYGKGVSADPATAARLLQTGCDQDHDVASCRNLYSVSWDGKGSLSKPAAADGLEGLCTKGDPMSCMLAGNAYRSGASPGLAQSPKKAKLYFDRACKLGVKDGCKASPYPPPRPKTPCDELKSFAHTCYTESAAPDVSCADVYSVAEASAAAAGVTGEVGQEVATFCGRACQASKGGVAWSVVDAAISSSMPCPR